MIRSTVITIEVDAAWQDQWPTTSLSVGDVLVVTLDGEGSLVDLDAPLVNIEAAELDGLIARAGETL